jgi:hypothetical protein
MFTIVFLLSLCLIFLPLNTIAIKINKNDVIEQTNNEKTNYVSLNSISGNIRVRLIGGEWESKFLTAKIGSTLEFEIEINDWGTGEVFVVVDLPIFYGTPLLEYKIDSASSEPFEYDETGIVWYFNESVPSIITFKTEVINPGFNVAILVVMDEENFDEDIIWIEAKEKTSKNVKRNILQIRKNLLTNLITIFSTLLRQ